MPQREAPPSFEDDLQAAIFESKMILQASGSAPRHQGRGDLEEERMAMADTAPFPRIPAAANTDTVTLSPAQSDASVYVSGLDDASVYVSGLDMRLIDEEELRLHMGKLGGEIIGVRMNSSKRKAALLHAAVVTYLDRVSAEQACQHLNESTVYTLSLENFTIKVVPYKAELERTPKDDGLKVFASWRKSDEPRSEADVRAALAPHAKVRYLVMSPDIRHKPFANVWLEEDVSPELTRCVESGIPLDVIGWQLWLKPWEEPKRGFKWLPTESHSQRPSATAAEADQRPVQRPWTSSEGLAVSHAVSHAVLNAVLVSKLPFEATVEEVRVHCMVAGAVSSARRLPRNPSLKMGDRMVIEYDEPQAAQTAASQLRHSWLPTTERYHGRHIAVEPYSMDSGDLVDRGEHEERPAADHLNGLGVVRTQAARVQPQSIEAFASSRDLRLGDSLDDSAISGNQWQSAAISGNQSRTSQSSSVNADVPATRAAPSAFRDFPLQVTKDDEMSVIKGTKLMLTGEAGTFALLSRVSKHLKTSVDTQLPWERVCTHYGERQTAPKLRLH
jgi:RNA recognition motif-containing protein